MSVPPSDNPLTVIAGKAWLWAVIRGVLAIILGIIVLVAPISAAITFAILAGILALIEGVVSLVDAVRFRSLGGMALRIAVAVIDIIFGLLLLFWPGHALAAMVILVAIWAIVLGIGQIVVTLLIRRGQDGWYWGLVTGAIAVIFGIVLIAQPGIALITAAVIFGIFAIVFGIFWIAVGLVIRRAAA